MTDVITPGEILVEEFMRPLDLSAYALAKAIHVSQTRVGEIISGKRAITSDTALRLSKAFGTTAEFWLNLQAHYELETMTAKLRADLDSIQPLVAAS